MATDTNTGFFTTNRTHCEDCGQCLLNDATGADRHNCLKHLKTRIQVLEDAVERLQRSQETTDQGVCPMCFEPFQWKEDQEDHLKLTQPACVSLETGEVYFHDD